MELNKDCNEVALTVDPSFHGWRLDLFLCEKFPSKSRTQIQKWINDRIRLGNGTRAKTSTRVQADQVVKIYFAKIEEEIKEWHVPIVFEDEHLYAFDKPFGLVVHPTSRVFGNTFTEVLKNKLNQEQIHLIHRLDRQTSGLILVAKNSDVATKLTDLMMDKQMSKTYKARVYGHVAQDEMSIDLPIATDKESDISIRRKVHPAGLKSRTELKVLRRDDFGEGMTSTLVELCPITGRTHQLRVHAEAIGHPILGDSLYGKSDRQYLNIIHSCNSELRLLLHASSIRFAFGNKDYHIQTSLDPEFREDWQPSGLTRELYFDQKNR